MRGILIIQTAFIGDVILMTPVIAELKRLFPDSSIDVLVKKGNENLVANNPKIRNVYTFDKSTGKFRAMMDLIKSFRKQKYDLAINLHRFASSGMIATMSGAKMVIGFKKNPFSFLYSKRFDHQIGNGTHEVERNLTLIRSFGALPLVRPELFPSDKEINAVQEFTSVPFICLAPASVWKTKQLPESKWIELIKLIQESTIYLIGAPSDHDLCERIRVAAKNPKVFNLAGQHSLMETAALIGKAEKVYVNDSGPLHIASAMNTPTIAFFCSTIPEFGFGPLADRSEIREVKDLECRPCGLHGHNSCPKAHFNCGNQMNVNP